MIKEKEMGLKENITSFALQLGFDLVGFTHADKFEKAEHAINNYINMGITYPFIKIEASQRCNPQNSLPGAKTIVSAALAYTISDKYLPERPAGKFKGYVSRYAIGPDYHLVLRQKLTELGEYIKSIKSGARYRIVVDDELMIDRACAQRAGIGWFSPNTCITTQKYGSWVFLGEVLTDLEIEPDAPAFSECADCNRCVKACPTGALVKPYIMNPYRCLSYITQMSGYIPWEFRETMGHRIYGCDTCQMACPINNKAVSADKPELMPILNPVQDIVKLLDIDNNTFKLTFGGTAAGWRGKNIILRNAVIALGNYRDEAAIPTISKVLRESPSPVVRGHAAWALAVTSGVRAKTKLLEALKRETDDDARCEIEYVLSEVTV
jgi:epoxyqueuosine reductase